ncbi:MAG: Eco57I restriction-modification methylase domain-containing protein, partial [Chloroflexota bacterium]|nr:Eco57I restriction-modification methylase domain-containing protein [Chloroflexota bacterium]
MSAPDSICQLVEKFDRDKPDSETEVRIQFVDPLFSALGWDLRDKRQVRHEPRVIVREAGVERSKNPDYSFHIGNTRHFFVETKMPQKNLKRDPTPAFQLRRYGYSGKTPASVLTDFEEFCVYDCRVRPYQNDPASKARPLYIRYTDYIDKWEALESRFSREAVAQGALREWIEGERIRGGAGVDKDFLDDMEGWRELLAKDIALHNRGLSQRQLNLLVQRTIDRIVFLPIAEDRDIEAYERLRRAAKADSQVYEELKRLFIEADDKYNSGLFHFSDEKRASEPDRESLKIHIPDEPLRLVIEKLYYPDSPYEFSVMPAEILGQVYEQFLGKVIELSPGGAVRIEEKPEVRKAGGVYYTPSYIVDYIVEHTVGALLKEKTPDQAEKLRILDPACGSGSFLVGAYQYLLDWHLRYYAEHSRQYRNRRRETADGMILTTAEKRRILQNNIYGVDLDQNAVEVSKLSLLLKMLENESDAAGGQTLMFAAGGRILPDLSDNIKWGNSLIGSDFFRGPQATLFDDEEEMLKVKAFDWESEAGFGAIMAAGGFDAVIGNPPYVRQETLGREFKEYAKRKYETYAGTADLYTYFIERGVKLLNENGLFAFIVANKWMRARYGKPMRIWLQKQAIREIVDFGDLPVFEQATTYPCIFTIGKSAPQETFP